MNAQQARSRNAFDLIGKVVDLEDVLDALLAQPLADWDTFQPIRRHIMEEAGKVFPVLADNQPGLDAIYWPNFKWLAEESRKWTLERASTGAGPSTPAGVTPGKRA